MTTDRMEQLIVDLARDLTPVTRLPALRVRVARWLVAAVAVTGAGVWAIGARANLPRAMADPEVFVPLGLALLAAVSAAVLALRLSVPGVDRTRWARWVPIAIAAAWLATLMQLARAAGVAPGGLIREPFHAACVVRVAALSVLPALWLVRDVRRGVALDRGSAAALAALAGSALAAVAVQLVCPIDRPAHVLVSHALPAVALMLAGAAAARGLLARFSAPAAAPPAR